MRHGNIFFLGGFGTELASKVSKKSSKTAKQILFAASLSLDTSLLHVLQCFVGETFSDVTFLGEKKGDQRSSLNKEYHVF